MKSFCCSFLLLLIVSSISAQHVEIGLKTGGANYLGDLLADRFLASLEETGLYAGMTGTCHFSDRFALRTGFHVGRIGADDANNSRNALRQRRNLHFRSIIGEMELTVQLKLLPFHPLRPHHRFSPYVFTGIAVFRFNPQARRQNQWYDLQPLGTEGQGLPGYPKPYRLTQAAIPLGAGFRFAVTKNWNIGLEFSMRKTFTDYLDDISGYYPDLGELERGRGALARQLSWRTIERFPEALPPAPGAIRGDPGDLDWYIFAGVSLAYNFVEQGIYRSSGRKSRKLKCPKILKR